jgi:ribosomal protein L37AE/L43A
MPRQILSDEAWTEMVEMKKYLSSTLEKMKEEEKNWEKHSYLFLKFTERLKAITSFMKAFKDCYSCNDSAIIREMQS